MSQPDKILKWRDHFITFVVVGLYILALSFTVSAQSRQSDIKNWAFFIQSSVLWNTFHGSRYMAVPVFPPNVSIRDVSFILSRSSIKNSASWSGGFYGERRLVKNLWLSASLDYSERRELYVFDKDTLQAYPPMGSHGIQFSRITDNVYNLEFSLLGEWVLKDWFIAAGGTITKELRRTEHGVDLTGDSKLLYESLSSTNPYLKTLIPRILIGYDGLGKNERWRLLLGAERRRSEGSNKRWVDIRLGAGIRIGR